jgi:hypothetical protein
MTLRDLIDELEDAASELGDDADVRFAHQPRWAFEYSIGDVVTMPAKGKTPAVVYIGEGEQLGYLPSKASVALGWSEKRRGDEDDDEDEDDA